MLNSYPNGKKAPDCVKEAEYLENISQPGEVVVTKKGSNVRSNAIQVSCTVVSLLGKAYLMKSGCFYSSKMQKNWKRGCKCQWGGHGVAQPGERNRYMKLKYSLNSG